MQGIFQITGWQETPYIEGEGGSKKSLAKITQDYSGAIVGSSQTRFLMSYQSETQACFVGYEVITGKIGGKSGSFTLQHDGRFENGIASSNFVVVKDSGSGELINIEGAGSFESGEAGKACYEIKINTH